MAHSALQWNFLSSEFVGVSLSSISDSCTCSRVARISVTTLSQAVAESHRGIFVSSVPGEGSRQDSGRRKNVVFQSQDVGWDIYGNRIRKDGKRETAEKREGSRGREGGGGGDARRGERGQSGSKREPGRAEAGGSRRRKGLRTYVQGSGPFQGRAQGSGAVQESKRVPSFVKSFKVPPGTRADLGEEAGAAALDSEERVEDVGDMGTQATIRALVADLRQSGNEEEVERHLKEKTRAVGQEASSWFMVMDGVYKKTDWNAAVDPLRPYAIGQSWPLVLQIFRHVQQQHWYVPSTAWYARVIAFAGRSRRPEEAWSLLIELQGEELFPNTRVCNALLRSFLIAKMDPEADGVVAKMKESTDCRPDIMTYNILLEARSREGEVEAAEKVLEELKMDGFKPDEFTYTNLLHLYTRVENAERIEHVLLAMRAEGFAPNRPSVFAHIVVCLGKGGRMEGLQVALDCMKEAGVKANAETWNEVIRSFALLGDVERMEGALQDLDNSGLRRTASTYYFLFLGYRRCESPDLHVDRVQSLVSELKSFPFGSSRQLVGTYTAAINAFGVAGACTQMADTLHLLLERDCSPNVATLRALVGGFGNAGMVDEMDTVVEMMREVAEIDGKTADVLIEAYSQAGDEAKVKQWKEYREGISKKL